jgi:hypothetical protein
MKSNEFDILIKFHSGLIRRKLNDKTIKHAKELMLTGETTAKNHDKVRARKLVETVKTRQEQLAQWFKGGNEKKEWLYCGINSRVPSKEVFTASFKVINGESTHFKSSRLHGVNEQCVRSLVIRLKRWDKYAKMLSETSELNITT